MLDSRRLRIKAAAFFTSSLIIRCVSPLGLTFLIIIWPTRCFCHLKRGRKACLIFKAHWKDSAFEIGCKLRFCSNQGPWNIDQLQLKTGFFFSFLFCFRLFFPHSPWTVLFISTNVVQLAQEVREKGSCSSGRWCGPGWGRAGQEWGMFVDDHWMPWDRPTWHWQQLSLLGTRVHHFRWKDFWTPV